MLKLTNVNKYYGKYHALKDINLFVEEGEFVAILGESGSGKSTLLNVVSGLDSYDSGDILINGLSTESFSKKDFAIYRNNYVGFVFQEYNLIDHLSVVENVELPLLLQGVASKEARNRAIEKCQLLGLKNHLNKPPKKLSGGQQQRVAIARALVTEPKLILADEPTGALDSENAKIILDILKVISKDHMVILVTHDEEFAYEYATRIVTLSDGEIIHDTVNKSEKPFDYQTLNLKRPNMKPKVLFKFAKNNILKRFLRTVFTSLTMSIGLISIFLIMFLINGIRTEVVDFINEIIPQDQYFVKPELKTGIISEEDLQLVREMDEVDEVYFQYRVIPLTNQIWGEGLYQLDKFTLTGIPNDLKNYVYRNQLVGSYPQNENEVIITSSLASQLTHINDIKEEDLENVLALLKNDAIDVTRVSSSNEVNESFKIVGIIDGYSFEAFVLNTKLESYVQSMSEEDIKDYYTSRYNPLYDESSLNVFLKSDRNRDIESLKDKLATHELILNNPTQVVYGSINNFFDTVLYVLLTTAGISLVVAGILVGLMVYISVLERIKEIGILTAIGAKATNIINLFIFESGFIGLFSATIALGISLLVTLMINAIFDSTVAEVFRTLNIATFEEFSLLHVDVVSVVVVFLISVVFAIICGLIPAILASRLKSIEALRKE